MSMSSESPYLTADDKGRLLSLLGGVRGRRSSRSSITVITDDIASARSLCVGHLLAADVFPQHLGLVGQHIMEAEYAAAFLATQNDPASAELTRISGDARDCVFSAYCKTSGRQPIETLPTEDKDVAINSWFESQADLLQLRSFKSPANTSSRKPQRGSLYTGLHGPQIESTGTPWLSRLSMQHQSLRKDPEDFAKKAVQSFEKSEKTLFEESARTAADVFGHLTPQAPKTE